MLCQKYGNDEPLVVPIHGPKAQFPALVTADKFPLFPFTEQFNTGIEINPANKVVRLSLVTLIFRFLDGVIGIWTRIYTLDTLMSTLRPAIKLAPRIH
ncbi:hypothetical protein ANCCAN_10271 [Ancylostoma caninum]|uniref:Uncharacterized protein n=1 Tax=Ancylostoma caninum TaxID=29170 RepID=A0A368GLD4_ANCCA|nr:hypothetical protein ANCCAN_10271 [Ancylostoma caninum]